MLWRYKTRQDEYLNDFIEEINLLKKYGVYIDKKKYAVQLRGSFRGPKNAKILGIFFFI